MAELPEEHLRKAHEYLSDAEGGLQSIHDGVLSASFPNSNKTALEERLLKKSAELDEKLSRIPRVQAFLKMRGLTSTKDLGEEGMTDLKHHLEKLIAEEGQNAKAD